MMCAKTDRFELFKKILEFKADVNAQTPHGDTCLHIIAQLKPKHQIEFSQELIKHGASVHLVTKQNTTGKNKKKIYWSNNEIIEKIFTC